jgi:Tfp pilus assembly protein PilF
MGRALATVLILALAGCATTGTPEARKVAEGYYDRGVSHLQVKEYEKAIVEFQRSIKTDKTFKMSYYALGVVNDMMGKYADAEHYYKEAIDIDAEFSEAYNALGVVYYKQQRWKEAQKSFQKALDNKLYATPHVPYLNMGDMYMARQEYAKAVEAYRESKRLVNQDITLYKLGTALLAAGNARDAVSELQEGVTLAPRNIDMRLALGLALLKDGNKRSALAEFKKVVELAPKSEAAKTAQDYITTLNKSESSRTRPK